MELIIKIKHMALIKHLIGTPLKNLGSELEWLLFK
jgi:hypothetical protein